MALPTVSVLVPVYNVERYLAQCLDSLCAQSLENIEIICIDDGSTDSSPSVLADYAALDGRIRVLSKPNTGYGDSMNRGLEAARGAWVGICEPDDFVDRRMFERLVDAGERSGCDIAKSNYCEHRSGARRDARAAVLSAFGYRKSFSPRDIPEILLVPPSIWTAVYRRSMIEGNGISFSPTPGASYQDASFAHQCWTSARKAVLLRPGFYHYRVDNEASSSKSGAKVFAVCDEYERSFSFLRGRGVDDLRLFGPVLNVARHSAYLWNYNRIVSEYHKVFALRWAQDMVSAYDEGLLDASRMTVGFRALLYELLEDVDGFCARYPDEIPVPPIM